jgi:hypothetical protein
MMDGRGGTERKRRKIRINKREEYKEADKKTERNTKRQKRKPRR